MQSHRNQSSPAASLTARVVALGRFHFARGAVLRSSRRIALWNSMDQTADQLAHHEELYREAYGRRLAAYRKLAGNGTRTLRALDRCAGRVIAAAA
jgi:hypothetical protein